MEIRKHWEDSYGSMFKDDKEVWIQIPSMEWLTTDKKTLMSSKCDNLKIIAIVPHDGTWDLIRKGGEKISPLSDYLKESDANQ